MIKLLKFIFIFAALFFAAIFIYPNLNQTAKNNENPDLKISTSTLNLPVFQNAATTSESIATESAVKIVKPKIAPNPISYVAPSAVVKEVSSKSFGELINGSVIQLYCGYYNTEAMTFSNIARGTGIIINDKGEILTNRHVIYDENAKKIKSDCFVIKTPFPNEKSQNPKIYYTAKIVSYPAGERFNESFSKDKNYNDFAILKIASKLNSESKMNYLLGFDYASPDDYSVLENSSGVFNFLPIDWNYRPKDGDILITLGYGVDASHNANKITSTTGKLSGNIDIDGSLKPQILLVESNATAGFSGGALINPQSKGLVGLISWITNGNGANGTSEYTVAIFRDFLRTLMFQDLNFDLK